MINNSIWKKWYIYRARWFIHKNFCGKPIWYLTSNSGHGICKYDRTFKNLVYLNLLLFYHNYFRRWFYKARLKYFRVIPSPHFEFRVGFHDHWKGSNLLVYKFPKVQFKQYKIVSIYYGKRVYSTKFHSKYSCLHSF